MKITCDPAKRGWTLRERGLDFEHAAQVFAGPTIDIPDLRRDYGERRINSVGPPERPHDDRVLDTARRGAARHVDEEGE